MSYLPYFWGYIYPYMKKALIVALAVAGLASCGKLKSLADIKFSVPYSERVEVKGLPNNPFILPQGLTASIPPIAVETKSEEYIKQYNTSSTLITEVKLGELKLEINEPATQTFDIMDSVWLFVSASGLPEIQAAYYFDIPKGIKTLDLITSGDNLKEYFLQDSMYFRIQGHFYKAPDSASVFTISTRFDAIANPLNKEE